MGVVILGKSLSKGFQSFEISVVYDPETNTVNEIKTIRLKTNGQEWPVDELLMEWFEGPINKIIDETDWREVYRRKGECDSTENDTCDINLSFQFCLQPLLNWDGSIIIAGLIDCNTGFFFSFLSFNYG